MTTWVCLPATGLNQAPADLRAKQQESHAQVEHLRREANMLKARIGGDDAAAPKPSDIAEVSPFPAAPPAPLAACLQTMCRLYGDHISARAVFKTYCATYRSLAGDRRCALVRMGHGAKVPRRPANIRVEGPAESSGPTRGLAIRVLGIASPPYNLHAPCQAARVVSLHLSKQKPHTFALFLKLYCMNIQWGTCR